MLQNYESLLVREISQMETKRLFCRPFDVNDVPALFSFLGDPKAMQYTYCYRSEEECYRRLTVHENQRVKLGIAPWTILDKSTEQIVGWGGLYEDPFDIGYGSELAYFFSGNVWGFGFGTEFAKACLKFSHLNTNLTTLTAFAHPDNVGSQKILRRVGFASIGFNNSLQRSVFNFEFSREKNFTSRR